MYENVINYCTEFKYKLFVQNKPPVLNLQLFTNLVYTIAVKSSSMITDMSTPCRQKHEKEHIRKTLKYKSVENMIAKKA